MSWALVYKRNSLLGALDCGRQLLHYPVSHLFHFDGAFPNKIGLADSSGKNTFVIYDFAVYDRGIDVLLGRGIDDSRFRVVIWEGLQMPRVKQDHIGLFSHLQRADQVLHPDRLCARAGCHPDHLICRYHRGVPMDALLDQRCQLHRFKHICAVVAGGSVRAEGDVDPRTETFRNQWDAGPQI